MTHLSDEQIEEAFARIRAEFEKRNNETGLEILDSYEEQWATTGTVSVIGNNHGSTASWTGHGGLSDQIPGQMQR